MLELLKLFIYLFKFIMADLFKNYNSSNVEKIHPPKESLFDDLLNIEPIFDNKEILRHSFTPDELLHRDSEINTIASILVTALRGDTPSNILIYGKTGTGKTASVRYVSRELKRTSIQYNVPCDVEYINCEVVDTKYRILAQLANIFIDKNTAFILEEINKLNNQSSNLKINEDNYHLSEYSDPDSIENKISQLNSDLNSFTKVPMTGWPTDSVYSTLLRAVDYRERVVVIMLDEIDKLVEKSGDDVLYNLSRINSDLKHSRVSIEGISNDLTFTDYLDPRVKSSLGEEEIIFPPYNANQLNDILENRATLAFKEGVLAPGVISKCSALAAREHGDARRALDLLRTSGELAERSRETTVTINHVDLAQEKIEIDRVIEIVKTLPRHSQLILFAIITLEEKDISHISTGEVYNLYRQFCKEQNFDVITHRRATDLISELDMLGIVNAVVVSKGRYGRTKQIALSVSIDNVKKELLSNQPLFGGISNSSILLQSNFDNV